MRSTDACHSFTPMWSTVPTIDKLAIDFNERDGWQSQLVEVSEQIRHTDGDSEGLGLRKRRYKKGRRYVSDACGLYARRRSGRNER